MALFGGMPGYGMFGGGNGLLSGAAPQEIGWAQKIGALLQDAGSAYDGRQGYAVPMLAFQQNRLGEQKKYQDTLDQLSAPPSTSLTPPQLSFPGGSPAPGTLQIDNPGAINATPGGPLSGGQFEQMLPLLRGLDQERGVPLLFNAMQDAQTAQRQDNRYAQEQAALTRRPATPEEKQRYGLDPLTPAEIDGRGNITPISDPRAITPYQRESLNLQRSRLNSGGEGRQENWGQPVTESGPDGKPIQVRYGSNGGRMVVEGAAPKPQSRAPGTRMVDGLVKVGTNLENLERLNTTFKPEFAGNYIMGGAENFLRRNRPGGDPSGQAQWWQDYQSYVNQVRNDLFGAALTPGEKAEFEKSIITPRMSPEESAKNLARQQQISTRAAQRQAKAYVSMGYDKEAIEGALGYGVDDLVRKDTPLANPQAQAQAQQPVRVASDADYDRLPSGSVFIGPDGKQRRKP